MAAAPTLEALRRAAPGRLQRCRAGDVHLVEEGAAAHPPAGRTILLIHGATVPNWEFDLLVPHLRAAGWRVVRFDLFGHGLSDRPQVAYDFELFRGQALEILDGLREAPRLTVLGHSFGAALAAAITAERPARVERLILVAPLLNFMTGAWWPRLFALPGVGRHLMKHLGMPALARRRERRYAAIGASHFTPRFLAQARAPGYAEALASMFANHTLGDQRRHYQGLRPGAQALQVLAGAQDTVIPLADIARVRALLPAHDYHELAQAEHNLLLTHPAEVAAVITAGGGGQACQTP